MRIYRRRSFNFLLVACLAIFCYLFTKLIANSPGVTYINYNKFPGSDQIQILLKGQWPRAAVPTYSTKAAVASVEVSTFVDTSTPATTAALDETVYHPDVILANNTICDRNLDVLIYIQSHWKNFMKRRILRNTWASKSTFVKVNVSVAFILGKPETVSDQIKINTEQLIYGDIIEADFLESYQNISLKSKIAMRWIHEHCASSKYIVKTDDDMFVNIFEVFEHILPSINSSKNVIACHVKGEGTSRIIRDKNSKWYIPEKFFPNMTTFPRFCTGYAVIMTSTLMNNLYKASRHAAAVPVDDVYMFGVLTQEIKDIEFVNMHDRFTLSQGKGINAYSEGDTKSFIVVAAPDAGAMEELWSYTLLDLSTWARKLATLPADN